MSFLDETDEVHWSEYYSYGDPSVDHTHTTTFSKRRDVPVDEQVSDSDAIIELFVSLILSLCSRGRWTQTDVPQQDPWVMDVPAGPSSTSAALRRGYFGGYLPELQQMYIVKQPMRNIGADLSRIREVLAAYVSEVRVYTHKCLQGHRNIVQIEGILWEHNLISSIDLLPSIQLEYTPLGSLTKFQQYQYCYLSTKVSLAQDIGDGLAKLLSCAIIHGDVKPDNILIFPNTDKRPGRTPFVAKLTDFNLSLIAPDNEATARGHSPAWCAPEWEESRGMAALHAADLFSYGLVLLKFFTMYEHPDTDKLQTAEWVKQMMLVKREKDFLDRVLAAIEQTQDLDHDTKRILSATSQNLLCAVPSKRRLSQARTVLSVKTSASDTTLDAPDTNTCIREIPELPPNIWTLGLSASNSGHDAIDSALRLFLDIGTPLARCYRPWTLFQTSLYQFRSQSTLDLELGFRQLYRSAQAGYTPAQALCFQADDSDAEEDDEPILDFLSLGMFTGSVVARIQLRHTDEERYDEVHAARRRLLVMYGLDPARLREAWSTFGTESTTLWPKSADLQHRQLLQYRWDTIPQWIKQLEATPTFQDRLESWTSLPPDLVINDLGDTTLHVACRAGDVQTALHLLSSGSKLSTANSLGETPLHWLSSFEEDDVARLVPELLDAAKILDKTAQQSSLYGLANFVHFESSLVDEEQLQTALARAVFARNKAVVNALLTFRRQQKLPLVQPLEQAFSIAIMLKFDEIVELLVGCSDAEKVLNVEKCLVPMYRRCLWAIERRYTMTDPALKRRVYFESKSRRSPITKLFDHQGYAVLLNTCISGRDAEALNIIRAVASMITFVGENGETLLSFLAANERADCLYALLEADTDARTSYLINIASESSGGFTPLSIALASGNRDLFDSLLDHGATLEQPFLSPGNLLNTVVGLPETEALELLEHLVSRGIAYDYKEVGITSFMYGSMFTPASDPFLLALAFGKLKLATYLLQLSGGIALNSSVRTKVRFLTWKYHSRYRNPLKELCSPMNELDVSSDDMLPAIRYLFESTSEFGRLDVICVPFLNMTVLQLYLSRGFVFKRFGHEELVSDGQSLHKPDDKIAIYLVEKLAESGHINHMDRFGMTALKYAVGAGRLNVVDALLKAGADPNLCRSPFWSGIFAAMPALDFAPPGLFSPLRTDPLRADHIMDAVETEVRIEILLRKAGGIAFANMENKGRKRVALVLSCIVFWPVYVFLAAISC